MQVTAIGKYIVISASEMVKKQTGWPFQEGYVLIEGIEFHGFTDYRWNDGSVSRLWHIDPENHDVASIRLRAFSLPAPKPTDK